MPDYLWIRRRGRRRRTRLRGALLLPAVLAFLVLAASVRRAAAEIAVDACASDSPASRASARAKAREMFFHAYNNYKAHALPRDELRSLSCDGVDSFGGVQVTLIDSLDALAVFEDWPEFVWAAKYVEAAVPSFAIQTNVSVFETNIRVLGALVSAHGLLTDAAPAAGWRPAEHYPEYDGGLLRLAIDLGDRLMPAFDTPTRIPFGSVGLDVGVHPGETVIASTAGAGGLLVEMGTLSVMSGDPKYYAAAFGAVAALHERAAWTGLVGNHIDTTTGAWVAHESGIGALIDSYYEYGSACPPPAVPAQALCPGTAH
jgi:ER degradation enhancer, mannosidase alpha-like 2